ncbi:hypothetical protein DZF87_24470 [Vibrio parahaemolyticus]|uniref:hypothetical protein n=1 Tax=Vibrio parahaemolyticus TaxID=670 RepID=UPI00112467C8|nr:hypothetical protein [Vibrio parahaemolyticus]EGR2191088.1 hypothetical protein [Vibrio parahaemolyticus]TOL18679.1 hypothetical protein CGI02_24360 [Vibrio parahaemolyticus]
MDVFNNREIASATLVALVFLWASYKSNEVLPAVKLVFSSLRQKAIVITTSTLALYIVLVVLVLEHCQIWNTGQLKNTILWFVFIGFVQLFNTTKITDPKVYLQESLNSQIKLIVLVEFLVAFHSYNFFAELALVTVSSLLACCSAFSKNKPEYQQAKKLCDYILATIGILILLDSIVTVYQMPNKFFSVETFRDFLVPMLLSVSLLPYIYAFYYFLAYERAFIKTRIYTDSKSLQRYAKWRSFIAFKGNPKMIHQWLLNSCIPEFESRKTIQASIRSFKDKQSEPTV